MGILLVRFNIQIQCLSKLENSIQLCVWFAPFFVIRLNPVMSLVKKKYGEIVFLINPRYLLQSFEKLLGI